MNSMVTTVALHPLTPDWVTAAGALDREILGGLWTTEGYQRELDSPNGVLLALSCAAGGTVAMERCVGDRALIGLGCLWLILDEAHITILGIDAALRRQGLGRVLLLSLLKEARQQGMERATLEVRASNAGAIALYQSYGFQEAGQRKRYYQNPVEDACILWRGGLQLSAFAEEIKQWEVAVGDRLRRAGWCLVTDAMLRPSERL